MLERLTVDLNPNSPKHNKKQKIFIDEVLKAASNKQQYELKKKKLVSLPSDHPDYEITLSRVTELEALLENGYKRFHYGGGIRGGKTTVVIVALLMLCKFFPRSRWHIVRKSFPVLTGNTVKSVEEILRYSQDIYWKRSPQEYFCQFPNGSRIYFITESYNQDKQLTKFLGMETNGIVFEQLEEIQKDSFDMICSRAGSYLGVDGPMPPALIMDTFNVTYTWVKEEIHDAFVNGTLPADEFYCEALPEDNPWVTKDQWANWDKLDEETKNRLIKSIWDIPVKDQFFSSFDEKRNVSKIPLMFDFSKHIIASFDFNVDPMTATLSQSDGANYIHFLREFRIENSDTYGLCAEIKPLIEGMEHLLIVTGDASGNNRMSGTRGHINHYQIIKEQLGIRESQIKVPSVNPGISDSRVFMNSLLEKLPEFLIDPSCKHLIKDFKFVEKTIGLDGKVGIAKGGINRNLGIDNNMLGHLSDTARYACHFVLIHWLKLHKS
jgi:hypothetical protein